MEPSIFATNRDDPRDDYATLDAARRLDDQNRRHGGSAAAQQPKEMRCTADPHGWIKAHEIAGVLRR